MGRTMILGGEGPEVSAATVRTGPGLGAGAQAAHRHAFRGARPAAHGCSSAVALDPDHLGVGIDENTAILVEGDTFEVLGTGVATVADGERSTVVHAAGDCDPITLFDVRLHLMPAGAYSTSPRGSRASGPRTPATEPQPAPFAEPGLASGQPARGPRRGPTEGASVRLIDSHRLSGPNIFTSAPVAVARLELDGLTGQETSDCPGFAERLTAALPGLGGTTAPRDVPAASRRAGPRHLLRPRDRARGARAVRPGRPRGALRPHRLAGADGRYDVIMECPRDEPAYSAVPGTCQAGHARWSPRSSPSATGAASPDALEPIARAVDASRLGPSDRRDRRGGPPPRHPGPAVGELSSLLRLGLRLPPPAGLRRPHRADLGLGVDIAGDKVLAKQLLARRGFRFPPGSVASVAAERRGGRSTQLRAPVVIKPSNGNHGRMRHRRRRVPPAQAGQAYQRAATGAGGRGRRRGVCAWPGLPGPRRRTGTWSPRPGCIRASVTGDGRQDIEAWSGRPTPTRAGATGTPAR